jgi:hypothetical protein
MNCDQCKEQIFELIERETVDPDGVREVLARCPDCRAAFDEIKAALALAEQMPIEEPPAAVDATILRAAGERKPRVVPLRKRRLQPPPWAMAAIALLAVGVGVWTIPQKVQFEGDVAPADNALADKKNAEPVLLAEEVTQEIAEAAAEETREEEAKLDGRIAGLADNGPLRRVESPGAKEQKASPEPARARRRLPSSVDESSGGRAAQAPASLPAADVAAENVAAKASAPRKLERDDDATAACKRKVDDIERRARAGKDDAPTPEEELAIGKCYQALDNVAEARKWLERAAGHRKTKAPAEKALRELAPE